LAYRNADVRRLFVIAVLGLVGLIGNACSQMRSPVGPTPGGTASFAAELALCVDETNRYRASIGQGPLARSQALEDFAMQAAEYDAQARAAHQHFVQTNGAGLSRAETEILWWRGFAVRSVVERGLAQMWQVGPGGEHYDIMAGNYSEIGCGIFVNGNEVTVAQDFR
jgi:uncharacterized protein YkwD